MLPHFCITPRGVEGDGADFLCALYGVDGQLSGGGGGGDEGGVICRVKDGSGGKQCRAAHDIPPPQKQDLYFFHNGHAPFQILLSSYAQAGWFSTARHLC